MRRHLRGKTLALQVATLQANDCGQRNARADKRGSRATVQALLQLSPKKGRNTNTRKLCAANATGARVPPRTDLMCSRLVFRPSAMAAARDDTDPCASRLCLLSMARALPAERLLGNRLPHVRHTETAMRTLLGVQTEVFEPQTSQYA